MNVERIVYDEELLEEVLPKSVTAMVKKDTTIVFGLFDEGVCRGIALFNPVSNDKCLNMIYIFVAEELREQGIGSAFLSDICSILSKSGIDGIYVRNVGPESLVNDLDYFFKINSFFELDRPRKRLEYKVKNLQYEKLLTFEKEILSKSYKLMNIKSMAELKSVVRDLEGIDLYHLLSYELDFDFSELYESKGKFVGGILVSREGKSIIITDMIFGDIPDQKKLILFVGALKNICNKCMENRDIENLIFRNVYEENVKKAMTIIGYPYKELLSKDYYFSLYKYADEWKEDENV